MIEIICSGIGGQGVLVAGMVLADIAMEDGKNVSWYPSYGFEMRGGAANCEVKIGDEDLQRPYCLEPDILLTMSESAIDTFEERLKPGSYILMTERLERKQMNRLIQLCDVYISLHRSEGFGLVMAEAMNLGTAAVATHWSANAEFMPEGTACNVSSRQIPVGDAYQDAPEGLTWADADVHEAAGYLRRLKDDPAYREEITRAGQAYIREQLSVAACTEKISKRLDEIIQNSEFRIQN